MFPTYTQKQSPTQKKDASSASSVLDASSQSEALQRKADMANNAAQHEEASRPNNTGMPDNLKSGIESLSGFSMDDVRVHYNSSKPATVQALAYTQGTDIHVAPGQEKHLPHEAWHVAQQMAGRVSPTTNINGMPVNDNAALEHEADVMGEKAVQCKEKCAGKKNYCSNKSSNNIFQLMNVNCLSGGAVTETKKIHKYRDLCDFLTSHKSYLSVDFGDGVQNRISDVKTNLINKLNVEASTLGREIYGQIDIFWCDSIDEVVSKLTQIQIPAAPVVIPQRSIEDIIRDDFILNENVHILKHSQIRHLSEYKENGPIKTKYYDTHGFLYHVEGHSKILKPIWCLINGKIEVWGLYQHPDGDWQQYNLKEGSGPKTINIIE